MPVSRDEASPVEKRRAATPLPAGPPDTAIRSRSPDSRRENPSSAVSGDPLRSRPADRLSSPRPPRGRPATVVALRRRPISGCQFFRGGNSRCQIRNLQRGGPRGSGGDVPATGAHGGSRSVAGVHDPGAGDSRRQRFAEESATRGRGCPGVGVTVTSPNLPGSRTAVTSVNGGLFLFHASAQ